MNPLIRIEDLHKKYGEHVVFKDFNLEIIEHSFNVIYGASGSGKSTLLNMIGLLDKPDFGSIELFGMKNIQPFTKRAEALLKYKIGYLFQNYALIENETVLYNLEIPLIGIKKVERRSMIEQALFQVGLSGYEKKKVYECSGGEQQRIALARLILKPCELILADEPTGSLDEDNKKQVLKILKGMHNNKKTIIIVTHDKQIIESAECKYRIGNE